MRNDRVTRGSCAPDSRLPTHAGVMDGVTEIAPAGAGNAPDAGSVPAAGGPGGAA